jgi:hypothetical protein
MQLRVKFFFSTVCTRQTSPLLRIPMRCAPPITWQSITGSLKSRCDTLLLNGRISPTQSRTIRIYGKTNVTQGTKHIGTVFIARNPRLLDVNGCLNVRPHLCKMIPKPHLLICCWYYVPLYTLPPSHFAWSSQPLRQKDTLIYHLFINTEQFGLGTPSLYRRTA